MSAYYNEHDPFAAAWLRELITDGLIADGDVDERSIEDVTAADLRGFVQCHFFAGIGGWSLALRLAGWDDDRPVWTGSCPCQPFSAAGKGEGFNDPRHLWPVWFRLIRECRPDVVFGEQIAAKAGLAWFDHVATDLEKEAYAVGALDLGAPSVGGYHIRQRLWWVADTERGATERYGFDVGAAASRAQGAAQERQRLRPDAGDGLTTGLLADSEHPERRPIGLNREDGRNGQDSGREEAHGESGARGEVRDVADTDRSGRDGAGLHLLERQSRSTGVVSAGSGEVDGLADTAHANRWSGERGAETGVGPNGERWRGSASGGETGELGVSPGGGCERIGDQPAHRESVQTNPWADVIWHLCRDGKRRPIPLESAFQPLVDGLSPGRVGLLRGAGNSIVPALGAAFIQAYLDARS